MASRIRPHVIGQKFSALSKEMLNTDSEGVSTKSCEIHVCFVSKILLSQRITQMSVLEIGVFDTMHSKTCVVLKAAFCVKQSVSFSVTSVDDSGHVSSFIASCFPEAVKTWGRFLQI